MRLSDVTLAVSGGDPNKENLNSFPHYFVIKKFTYEIVTNAVEYYVQPETITWLLEYIDYLSK